MHKSERSGEEEESVKSLKAAVDGQMSFLLEDAFKVSILVLAKLRKS